MSTPTNLRGAQRSLGRWASRRPQPITSRTHVILDLLAFPAMLGIYAWLRSRNRRAANLVLTNVLLEGTMTAITDFRPGPGMLGLIGFRQHVRNGLIGLPPYLAAAALVPGIPWRYRRLPLLLGVLPLVLNGLSDTSEIRPA